MSRSLRRARFIGITTAQSDKPWKRTVSRQYRRICAVLMAVGATELPIAKKTQDRDSDKDGKRWIRSDELELMRK